MGLVSEEGGTSLQNGSSTGGVKNSLRIVGQEAPLRREGPFVAPLSGKPLEESPPQPRALRGLARIIDGGLCHRCGSCVGICPTGVLGLDEEEYPTIKNLSACTDCDLCMKVCPGDEFNFHSAHESLFGERGDITSTHGNFKTALISHSSDADIQEKSTSGGLVSDILIYLLESNQIDGAVVIASDPGILWKGRPMVARSKQEVLSAMKSKYAISPTNTMFSEIRNLQGRYALVGLPCQIHGFVKAAELDARIKERVVLTIGLFCHAAIEHEGLRIIWESIDSEKRKRAKRYISRVGKHPGTPHLELDDGTLHPVYFSNRSGFRPSSMEIINIVYRLYTPSRCLTCFDASAEFADIAVGDPWMAPPNPSVDFYKGWSFALVRSARAQKIIDGLISEGRIVHEPVTRREALACNRMMATEKRWRAFRIIETLRRQGRPIPAYGEHGFRLPSQSGKQFVKTELHMLTHIFCYLPRFRAAVLRFFLSDGGYGLLWLNNKRRALRFWVRDTKARVLRKFFGRR
ncbi:MAG: Coenzyme F420 hydrogenase/dehydrogenase, beta subunit C-terminal domain [Deltaproteobacteria bacterium]|nr:Coenzyme F420 hydrogenase/dehydrogenase, beta subunit C-terminal domain [Deltaproteobacteria bacterium]